MTVDPYPPVPEPTPVEREPLVLDPYEEDLLTLARAIRAGSAVAVAFILTSANHGRMLITAAKLLAEVTLDTAQVDPREMAESPGRGRAARGRRRRRRHRRAAPPLRSPVLRIRRRDRRPAWAAEITGRSQTGSPGVR